MSEPQPSREKQNPETAIQAGTPLPLGPTPGEPIAYQPISGWAIAGLVAGGLFALMVLVSTSVALFQGAPLFFPMWLLAIPIAGAIVAWIGERQVRESEGTRVGAGLARWGFWLCLVSALVYSAYYFVTGYAVQAQADAFLREPGEGSGFLPLLLQSGDDPAKLNAAFLLTMPAHDRGGRPDDERNMRARYDIPGKDGGTSGLLSQFRNGLFGRIFYKSLAKDAQIIPLEVRDWRYDKRSYKVYRKYRIKTKEVEMDLVFAVASTEAESGGHGRNWFVNLRDPAAGEADTARKFTPLGEGVLRLRAQAVQWLNRKLNAFNEGDTLPDIKHADQTKWDQLTIEGGQRDQRRALVYHAFAGPGKTRISQIMVLTRPDFPGEWEMVDGKIRVGLAFRIMLPRSSTDGMPLYAVEGNAMVDSRVAINPEQFKDDSPPPDWNISSLVFTSIIMMTEPKKGP